MPAIDVLRTSDHPSSPYICPGLIGEMPAALFGEVEGYSHIVVYFLFFVVFYIFSSPL